MPEFHRVNVTPKGAMSMLGAKQNQYGETYLSTIHNAFYIFIWYYIKILQRN